jgi:GNAT superfamily N-acetyltransferase
MKREHDMQYIWRDYDPQTMDFVESWLDEAAIRSTGLEDGFRDFYKYWEKEDGFSVGENYWCKVVYEKDQPFAVIALALYEGKVTVMELVVDPEKRGKGRGTKMLKELLGNEGILGFSVAYGEAVIFRKNVASQRAFENAGFRYHHTHPDGDDLIFAYKQNLER